MSEAWSDVQPENNGTPTNENQHCANRPSGQEPSLSSDVHRSCLIDRWCNRGHNLDLRSVPAFVTDLADAGVVEPECRPVAGLILQLDPSDVVAMGVLELAPCANAGVKLSGAVLQRADRQVPFAIERDGLGRPPTISTPVIWHVPLLA